MCAAVTKTGNRIHLDRTEDDLVRIFFEPFVFQYPFFQKIHTFPGTAASAAVPADIDMDIRRFFRFVFPSFKDRCQEILTDPADHFPGIFNAVISGIFRSAECDRTGDRIALLLYLLPGLGDEFACLSADMLFFFMPAHLETLSVFRREHLFGLFAPVRTDIVSKSFPCTDAMVFVGRCDISGTSHVDLQHMGTGSVMLRSHRMMDRYRTFFRRSQIFPIRLFIDIPAHHKSCRFSAARKCACRFACPIIVPLIQFLFLHGWQYIGILFPYILPVSLVPLFCTLLVSLQFFSQIPVFLIPPLIPVFPQFHLVDHLVFGCLLYQTGIIREFTPMRLCTLPLQDPSPQCPHLFSGTFIRRIQCTLRHIVCHLVKKLCTVFGIHYTRAEHLFQ